MTGKLVYMREVDLDFVLNQINEEEIKAKPELKKLEENCKEALAIIKSANKERMKAKEQKKAETMAIEKAAEEAAKKEIAAKAAVTEAKPAPAKKAAPKKK